MDGKQGIQLVRLISPKLTIPVHFDDYDVFAVSLRIDPSVILTLCVDAQLTLVYRLSQSPRSDFEKEVESAGLGEKVLYLDRGDAFEFGIRGRSDGS
jgi:hypothetical protein